MIGKPDFKLVGQLSIEVGDGVTSIGREGTDVYLCSRCGAIVGDTQAHGKWHTVAAIGMG